MELIESSPKKDPPVEIGKHPKDKKPITKRMGRWGPYVMHGRTMATIPKNLRDTDITLEQAVDLINAKAGKKGKGKTKAAAK